MKKQHKNIGNTTLLYNINNTMKFIILLPLFLCCTFAKAQVPPPKGEMSGSDYPTIAEPEMPPISEENRNAGTYRENNKYGFVYPQDKRQEAIYDLIQFSNNGFILKKGDLYGIANKKGVPISKIAFDTIAALNSNVYLIKMKGKYGTLASDGKQLLAIKYNTILFCDSKSGVSFVKTKNDEVQMISNANEKPFPSKIELAIVYANLVIVKTNGKFGVLKNGQTIIPFDFDSIYAPSEEYSNNKPKSAKPIAFNYSKYNTAIACLALKKNEKFGLSNSEGAIIYAADNDAVSNMALLNYYTVRKDKLFGIYFLASKKKTEIEFDKVYADGYGYVMAVKNNKAGVFNLNGEIIIPFEYDNDFIAQYSGLGLRVSKNKKRGIVDSKGNVIVPPIYDDVSTFYESGFNSFIKVTSDQKIGVVNLKGDIIIPVTYDYIDAEKGNFKVMTAAPDRRIGLYDKSGKVVVPVAYKWITKSTTENSKITILEKEDNSYNFLDEKMQLILTENVVDYGYVLNQDKLLNPFSSTNNYQLYVKDKNGKFGMLNENSGKLNIPIVYDEILQDFESGKHNYYSVKKGKKFGLINEENQIVIPIEYDSISLDGIVLDFESTTDENYQIVVAKGNKFGSVNLNNQIQIPFQYAALQRISDTGLYKAKTGNKYQIINSKNKAITKAQFDEVANFEQLSGFEYGDVATYQALTFSNGKMKVINDKGEFISSETEMQPHHGYTTFDELKFALITALDSKDDGMLKVFADNIAPTAAILYYLKRNQFDDTPLQYTDVAYIQEKYYKDLLNFKYSKWNEKSGHGYKRTSLTNVTDYTLYRSGLVTNERNADHAYGDTRFMEKLLRNAVKINGFWISTYFMKRGFN